MAEEEKKQKPAARYDDRVDEFAGQVFESMGYKGKLPDSVVRVYHEFKLRKDRFAPGKLTPDWFAFVAFMADLADGKIVLGKKE